MNETERAENATAEAVRGYMRDRTFWLKELASHNHIWEGFKEHQAFVSKEVAQIDEKVASLINSEIQSNQPPYLRGTYDPKGKL